MNDTSAKVKQQLVDKIKASTNILVTVSKNPDVDALSAALGLTALLNKLDKHATAIFSGAIPPAISFLEPDKVFENTADSLRDFIIALDKEKADHLRYKVDGDIVRIYITPYKTTLTSDDLQFSQGDYNVELVLALGVAAQEDLDVALSAHNILDNVTIITFSVGNQTSNLGSVDWHNEKASSLCEMVASLAEVSKDEEPLLDKQIATALLTGIVASTERFSNDKTSAQVMTVAANLMAAGADQQLIASKLEDEHAITSLPSVAKKSTKTDEPEPEATLSKARDGNLSIQHGPAAKVPTIGEILALRADEKAKGEKISQDMTKEHDSVFNVEASIPADASPMMGGTLNATSSQAEEDARREFLSDSNKTLLSHSYLSDDSEPGGSAINGVSEIAADEKPVDIFSDPVNQTEEPIREPEKVQTIQRPSEGPIEPEPAPTPPTPEPEPVPEPPVTEPAPDASTLAEGSAPQMPAEGLPLPPPVPDFSAPPGGGFSTLPSVSTQPETNMTDTNVIAPPPMPDTTISTVPEDTLSPVPVNAEDPGAFKIPGQ